ncbi:hypothetical protein GALMADRAFT_69351, partial [Galerina marginata CBS 339.88]
MGKHVCSVTCGVLSIFTKLKNSKDLVYHRENKFPPDRLTRQQVHPIVTRFCNEVSLKSVREEGCAVCGQLTLIKNLTGMDHIKDNLGLLEQTGVTRLPRVSKLHPVKEIDRPILASGCRRICQTCNKSLVKGMRPKFSLANGLWLGEVPEVLSSLRFAERILISRIRHNYCVVRVASGGRKLKANAIMFSNPMQKIYNKLPPPLAEMDEVLAYVYTGPTKPTHDDLKRTPLLVLLNHVGYSDLVIDQQALNTYPDDDAPVSILYYNSETNKNAEGTSSHDMDVEDGTETGDCLFTMLRAEALRHLNTNGKVLAIGHNDIPESIYNNPGLYPLMFPCLFPYGLGGIGTANIGDTLHKKHLLMYHDKRFQTDLHFPLIAFNHAQIKSTTKSGFILAD